MAALPDPETILPLPEAPEAPHPPHLTIGRGGRVPHAPAFHAPHAPHAPGNPANHPEPARIVHIHQGTPPVVQPGATPPPGRAAQQRGAVHQAMGQRIAQRMQGMPVENQRLFQTLIRGHAREHAKAYHESGKAYLRGQIDAIKARAKGQPGQTQGQVRHTVQRTNDAVNTGRAGGQRFVRVDQAEFDEPPEA